uniref:Uncharacterized protein n=1 Tax=Panagrolaimus sp. ES5 TaxID=591445 RepID=A0AC34G8R8_9BILA
RMKMMYKEDELYIFQTYVKKVDFLLLSSVSGF